MKKLLVFLLVLPAILFSCQKEVAEFDDVLADLELKSDYDGKETDGKGGACFEIQFPLTVVMPDDSEITADSREELGKAVKEWFTDNGKKHRQRMSFKYPITVVFKGKTLTLEGERGLERIKMACRGDKGGGKEGDKDRVACIELVYPVTFIMPDRTTLAVENKEVHAEAIKKWFEEHPDFQRQRPALQYPVDVVFKGRPMTLENEREMARLREACASGKEGDKDRKACFKMVYPLTYNMPDGTTISGDNEREVMAAIKAWYESNSSDKKPSLQFPIKINYGMTDRGDRILEIENQEALKKAYADCGK